MTVNKICVLHKTAVICRWWEFRCYGAPTQNVQANKKLKSILCIISSFILILSVLSSCLFLWPNSSFSDMGMLPSLILYVYTFVNTSWPIHKEKRTFWSLHLVYFTAGLTSTTHDPYLVMHDPDPLGPWSIERCKHLRQHIQCSNKPFVSRTLSLSILLSLSGFLF